MVEAPYASAEAVARRRLAMVAPQMSAARFEEVLARAGELGEFDPDRASAIEAVKRLDARLLVLHGLLDLTAPYEQSEAVFAAAGQPKELRRITTRVTGLVWEGRLKQMLLDLCAAADARGRAPATRPAD